MRHLAFDLDGNVVETAGNNHILVGNGFLDDTWFHRSFWTCGIGRINPRSGFGQGQGDGARIMVIDDQQLPRQSLSP